jgi:chromosome segregation ATPase
LKGSAIALVVLSIAAALVYLLLRESHADLERLEAETRSALDRANAQLVTVTRTINEIRAIRPNLPGIDEERAAMQRQVDEQSKNLAALSAARPTSRDSRADFIRARQAARDSATTLEGAAGQMAARIAVLEEFARTGQQSQHVLTEAIQRVFELRNSLTAKGQTIDPLLGEKLETMRRKRETLQEMSRSFFAAASGVKRSERDVAATPERLRIEAQTIENEARQLIDDLAAAYRELSGTP